MTIFFTLKVNFFPLNLFLHKSKAMLDKFLKAYIIFDILLQNIHV